MPERDAGPIKNAVSLFSGIILPLMGVTGGSPLWDFPFGKEGRPVPVAVLAHHSHTLSPHTQISPAGLASGRAGAPLNRLVESVTVIQTFGTKKEGKKRKEIWTAGESGSVSDAGFCGGQQISKYLVFMPRS